MSKELAAIEKEITKLYESKTPLSIGNLNITELESTKADLVESLEELMKMTTDFETQQEELTAESGSQAEIVHQLDGIEFTHDAANVHHGDLKLVQSKIDSLTEQRQATEAKLEHITEHEFDPDCEFCIRNNQSLAEQTKQLRDEVKDSFSQSYVLEEQSAGLRESLVEYDEIVIDYQSFKSASGLAQTAHSDLLSAVASISNLKAKVANKKSKLKEVRTNIKAYHRSVDVWIVLNRTR